MKKLRKCMECTNHHRDSHKLCPSCHSRKMRRLHPMRYAFENLRSNSKRRGIPFNLTFEQFAYFCFLIPYIQNKGITKDSLTIDRRDSTKGYTLDNLQAMTNSDNARKGIKKLEFDEEAYERGLGFRMRVYRIGGGQYGDQ